MAHRITIRRVALSGIALATLVACSTSRPPGETTPASPTEAAALSEAQRFAVWLAQFRASAAAAGIDEATLRAALDPAQIVHRAITSDRAQPEFTRAIWDYLDSAVSPQRVATGQQKLAEVRAAAEAAQARYGVPAAIVVAVWGIESNYGRNYGDIPVIDALATLGFEGRREAWAKNELMAALKIIQHGDIDHDRMIGSWAGAMGQTQFMPTAYLSHAVDADGDGRRDIWGSMDDVLASTANYLAKSGWQADEPWLVEVRLPEGFDAARAELTVRQPAQQWAQEGVTTIAGEPLPAMAEASIILPAGVRGPAFLVGRNYRAILRYNNAMSYALAVSLLAQGIDGQPGVQAAWPRETRPLTRSEILALQTALNARGLGSGQPDGVMGPATRSAVRQYQRAQGVPADGYPTPELLQQLQQPQDTPPVAP